MKVECSPKEISLFPKNWNNKNFKELTWHSDISKHTSFPALLGDSSPGLYLPSSEMDLVTLTWSLPAGRKEPMRKWKGTGGAVGWGGMGWGGGLCTDGLWCPSPKLRLHSAVRAPLPESMQQNTGVWKRLILNWGHWIRSFRDVYKVFTKQPALQTLAIA